MADASVIPCEIVEMKIKVFRRRMDESEILYPPGRESPFSMMGREICLHTFMI